MSENNYNTLSEESNGYPDTPASQESGWLETSMKTAALIGGGVFAYKSGLLRPVLKHGIRLAGNYRHGNVRGVMSGIKKFSKDEKFLEEVNHRTKGYLEKQKFIFQKLKEDIRESVEQVNENKRRSKEAGHVISKTPEIFEAINQRNALLNKLDKQGLNEKQRKAFRDLMDAEIRTKNNPTKEANEKMMKRLGYRLATVGELKEHTNMFKGDDEKFYNEWLRQGKEIDDNFENKIADSSIYFDPKTGKIIDTREFREGVGDFMDSLADDFTIPFIKINPIRMFYLKSFSTNKTPPLFHHFNDNEIHPTITGKNKDGKFVSLKHQENPKQYGFINGQVVGVDEAGNVDVVMKNARLVDTQGPWGRLISTMGGLHAVKHKPKEGFFGKVQWHVGRALDLGFQDEKVGGAGGYGPESFANESDAKGSGIVWWDLTTYPGAISYKLHDKFKPYESSEGVPRHKRFIDRFDSGPNESAQYTVISNYKKLDNNLEEWNRQFSAGRDNIQDTSSIGLTIYAFFERLNATLGQAGAALSSPHLGSARDIAVSLVTHRLAPIWLGMEAIDWFNYTGEQIIGDEPEDIAVEAYAKTQIGFAQIRDALGITDLFKNLADLMPGHEFLTEIAIPIPTTEGITPISIQDLLPLATSAEELEDYYEDGEQAVKKGRYWEFGNTPFVGGKIDYYEPNWLRRLTSDYEYTDTMWGSKDEYWENHALPSLQYPLAPIRHFFTDPYHWELKHYEDRPYPITGEIAEIRDIPLVGPLLSKTLGEILKPTKYMHTEEWMTPEGEEPNLVPRIYAEGQFGQMLTRMVPEEWSATAQESGLISVEMPPNALDYVQDIGTIAEEPVVVIPRGANVTTGDEDANGTLSVPIQSIKPNEGRYFSYTTPSGMMQVLQEGNMPLEDVQAVIDSGQSINAVLSQTQPMEIDYPSLIGHPDALVYENSWDMNLRDTWYNIAELGGFYGFSSNTAFGQPAPDTPVLERASNLTSYSKSFWEQSIGNLGGDFNEIFRRLLPREQTMEKFNPIRNTMPEWLPGEDYYLDFQHGDPYTAVQKGEIRLPGEAYETLYDVDYRGDLNIDGSLMGHDPLEMVKYWLHKRNAETSKYLERTINSTNKMFDEQGLLLDTNRAYSENGVETVADSIISDISNATGEAPVIVKGLSDEEYQQLGEAPLSRHQAELNFMTNSDNPNGYVMYYNADNTKERKLVQGEYDANQYQQSLENLQMAREVVQGKVASGELTRGDFYDPVSKFRILSDVAPYSDEYKAFKEEFRTLSLTDEQQEEAKEIREQLAARKDSFRLFTPYKYKTADVEKMDVTVSHILDNGMIVTEEFENPIRLAGVKIPTGKSEEAQATRAYMESIIQPGQVITVGLDRNEAERVTGDSYGSMKAVIYEGPDSNLAESLMEEGLASENEEDDSAPAVVARYNGLERAFGSLWESFAHMNTPYHTKFMQARSALEQYERRDVYGKDWQTWENPIDDFLVPSFQVAIGSVDSPGEILLAGAGGALLGSLFGATRFGKIMGAATGLTMTMAGLAYTQGVEAATGERWIPGRREEERALTEYMDALKYVKNQMLFDQYAEQSLEEEGFDVHEYIERKQLEGEQNKNEIQILEDYKRRLKVGDSEERMAVVREMQERFQIDIKDSQAALDFINEQLEKIRQERSIEELPELAATALMYYNESEKTLYGYDSGEPLANFIQALPRTDRAYFSEFMKAPEEEQERILSVVPDYMKRVLQGMWGFEQDPKTSLEDVFSENELPGPEWEGWNPNVNLDDVKVKIAKKEDMDMASMNIFKEDERRATQTSVRTPNFGQSSDPSHVQGRLHEIARSMGISNPTISVVPRYDSSGYNIEANVVQDRSQDILHVINHEGQELF